MYEFIKKLIDFKDRELTIMVLDDDSPESSSSYRFQPSKLLGLFYASIGVTVLIVIILVMFTPLGTLVYDHEDEKLRSSVIEISKKVKALQDSLDARDTQLQEIKTVLAEGDDTTFSVNSAIRPEPTADIEQSPPVFDEESELNAGRIISKNEIIFSGILKESPSFPAPLPVEGTLTRGFNRNTGHYGIDIATEENDIFKSFADGTVINQNWTINYGYVLHIQHENGIVSVYKHAASLSKEVGDIVLKGDILGTVGNTGVISSGPHLHLEIWRNGVPQDPLMYLVKS